MKTLAISFLAVAVTGCVSYSPRPIEPTAFPAAYEARRLGGRETRPVDEAALFSIGIETSPAIRDAAAAYRVALAAAKAARVRPLGTLTLTAEYSHQDNPNKPWLGNAGANVPLDIGARRSGRIDGADLAALQARFDYVEALWTMRSAIHRGVTELRAADETLPLATEAVAMRRERDQRLDSRVRAGEDARSAELLARTDFVAAEHRLTDAKGRRAQAVAALGKAIGLPATAIEGLRLAPAVETRVPPPGDIAAWRSEAVLARPDILRAVADYDVAEANLRIEVARQYPDIQIGPGYTYERGITKLPFSLSLALPPSDFNRAAIREAEARRTVAATKLEGVQAAAMASVDTTQAVLLTASDQTARTSGLDMAIAHRTAEDAARSLKFGATDRTDDLAARAALADAHIAQIDAVRVERLARVDLDDAVRPPLAPSETAAFARAMQRLEKEN